MKEKITVIGAGNVGTTTAQLIAERDLADVVIIDIIEGLSNKRDKVVTKMCVNFDTIDGMVRTEEHFSDTNDTRNICNQVFTVMCKEDNWEKHVNVFDSFWHLKERIL